MRPLGLLIIWKLSDTDPKWMIMKTALFGYYQNGLDYLNTYAQAKGWKPGVSYSNTVAYKTGNYTIELSLVEATGVDLSKETYLFQENVSEENQEAASS